MVALSVVAWAIASDDVPSPVAGAPTIEGRGSNGVSITWLGDTLLGDGAEPSLEQHGLAWPSALLPKLDFEHVVIANLEGPLTTRTEAFDPMQRWSYNARPEVAQALAAMGIDALSLANNHAMDRGPEGLNDTIANAQNAGLRVFGAGPTVDQAQLPLLVDSEQALIAVLGFSDDGGVKTASSERPGVRRLSQKSIQADIERARLAGADRVVAYVHWGENYASADLRQQEWARSFAAAGYDLVIGTGPHIAQPIAVVDGMPVVFSLGNYVFGTPGRFRDETQGFGLVLTTSFTGADELKIGLRCIQTDNAVVAYQPRPCDLTQTSTIMASVNPALVTAGDRATMTLLLPTRSE